MQSLTHGAVPKLLAGNIGGAPYRVQVLGVKKIQPGQGQAVRFKILVSDGENSTTCILATQLNNLAATNEITEGTILDITEAIQNINNGKNVIIVLNLTIVQQGAPKIGNPINVNSAAVLPAAPMYDQAVAPHSGAYNGRYGAPAPQQPYGAGGYGAPPPIANNAGGGAYAAPPQQQQQHIPAPNPYGAGAYGAPAQPPPNPYHAQAPMMQQQPHQHMQSNAGGYGAPPHNPYAAPQQPQYRAGAGGAIARDEAPPTVMPINALNSYQNRWTIKARVTQKSEIRRYSNARGEGKFFSFDVLDADGGEIRVVGWNDQCDRFFDQVEPGAVYMISKASLRNKRGNFNQTRHQFEVHLETGSVLEPVPDEAAIPKISFAFVPLSQLEDTPAGVTVDIIAVVESIADPADITRKDGTQVTKRGVNIRDASGRSIELTLWGNYCSDPGDRINQAIASGHHPVIAVKSARVGDFNGKTLSTVSSSTVKLDPVEPAESGQLRSWYDNGGATQVVNALSSARGPGGGRQDRRVCMSQIKSEGLGTQGVPAWVQASCFSTYVRNESYAYPACPLLYNGKQCNKKLVDQDGSGAMWFCERCGQNAAPDYRYVLHVQIDDHTGCQWVTAFNESGPGIMGGVSAADLQAWQHANDDRFQTTFKDSAFQQVVLKLKVQEEMYNEESKVKATVVRVDPADYIHETKWTLGAIQRLERGEEAYPQLAAVGMAPGGGEGLGAAANAGMPGNAQPWVAPAQQQQPQQGGYGGGYGGAVAPGGYGAPPQQQQQQGWGAPGAGGYGGGGGYGGPPPAGNQWGGGGGYGGGY